jgi:ankyrin repeat protein
MNMIKGLLALVALCFSLNSFALTDEEYLEFTEALGNGNTKVVKKYVDADPKLVNEKFFAWQPLQMAATKGRFETVKYLVEKGADLNYAHPASKMTAFHLAAFDGYEDIVKYLAAKGADVNIKMKGDVSLIRVMKDEGPRAEKMVQLLTSLGVSEEGCEGKCN